MEKIDLKRLEKRYVLPDGQQRALYRDLKNILKPVNFSNNHYSETIYLNTNDLKVPWGISLRARRYVKKPSKNVVINSLDKYICEYKEDKIFKKSNEKSKIRKEMRLNDFCRWAEKKLEKRMGRIHLRPHVFCQYKRQHFISDQEKGIRVTIDKNVRYGFFDQDSGFSWIGKEKGIRVETKVSKESQNSQLYNKLADIMKTKNYLDVISKKNQVHNFLKDWRFNNLPKLENELPDQEMESKISIDDDDPWLLLFKLKEAFRNREIRNYDLNFYPNTECTSRINYFYKTKNSKPEDIPIKLSFKINKFRLIYKSTSAPEKDSLHLQCILNRKEKKSKWINFSDFNRKKLSKLIEAELGDYTVSDFLERSRVAFWPINNQSGRLYRVGMDKCKVNGNFVYQIEIEHEGRLENGHKSKQNPEHEILHDLTYLTEKTLTLLNQNKIIATPTTQTKQKITEMS